MASLKVPAPMPPREYPNRVVAKGSAGAVQLRPGQPDAQAADVLNAASLVLTWLDVRPDDHEECTYLTYDPGTHVVSCCCGTPLFKVIAPVPEGVA